MNTLTLYFPEQEYFNEETMEFVKKNATKITLKHSLVSISEWESIWKVPFIGNPRRKDSGLRTPEQVISYIKCMTITQNVDPTVYDRLTQKHVDEVVEYVKDVKTATTINERNQRPSNRVVTSELIYTWMVMLNIPMECQKWHLSRLLTLIRVCSIESNQQQSTNKMSPKEMARQRSALNAARRAKHHTKG